MKVFDKNIRRMKKCSLQILDYSEKVFAEYHLSNTFFVVVNIQAISIWKIIRLFRILKYSKGTFDEYFC